MKLFQKMQGSFGDYYIDFFTDGYVIKEINNGTIIDGWILDLEHIQNEQEFFIFEDDVAKVKFYYKSISGKYSNKIIMVVNNYPFYLFLVSRNKYYKVFRFIDGQYKEVDLTSPIWSDIPKKFVAVNNLFNY